MNIEKYNYSIILQRRIVVCAVAAADDDDNGKYDFNRCDDNEVDGDHEVDCDVTAGIQYLL